MKALRFIGVAVIGCLLSGCGVLIKEMNMNGSGRDSGKTLTPQEAKTQVYDATKEILSTFHVEPRQVWFSYQSCMDDGDKPPFFAETGFDFIPTNEMIANASGITDLFRETLSRLPGWDNNPGDYKTHAAIIRKGDLVIELPDYRDGESNYHVNIDGPCTIKEDIRKWPVSVDQNTFITSGPLIPADVTPDFLPPGTKYSTPPYPPPKYTITPTPSK